MSTPLSRLSARLWSCEQIARSMSGLEDKALRDHVELWQGIHRILVAAQKDVAEMRRGGNLGRVAAIVLAFLALAGVANAQTVTLRGIGGSTAGHTTTSPILGGSVGVQVAPGLEIVGEAGRIGTTTSRDGAQVLDEEAVTLTQETGQQVTVSLRTPTLYAMGGIRYARPVSGRVSAYVEGLAGVARTTIDGRMQYGDRDLSETFTRLVSRDLGTAFTGSILAAGGGLSVDVGGPVNLTLGYRYSRTMVDDANVHGLVAGVGVTF